MPQNPERPLHRFNDNLIHWGPNGELVRALVAADVEFVLVGGLAVSWYCETREADDMDLLVNPTRENSQRIHTALCSLNHTGHDPDSFAKPGVQAPLKQQFYAELLTPPIGCPDFAAISESAEPAQLNSVPIRVASAAMLIRLVEWAIAANSEGREKHVADIELLRQREKQ